jgi:hypothetical protein
MNTNLTAYTKIRHQNCLWAMLIKDFGESGHQQGVRYKSKIPDFEQGRSDRSSSVPLKRDYGGWTGHYRGRATEYGKATQPFDLLHSARARGRRQGHKPTCPEFIEGVEW